MSDPEPIDVTKINRRLALRRIIASMKSTRAFKGGKGVHRFWLSGKNDDTKYFKAGEQELEKCIEEGLLG